MRSLFLVVFLGGLAWCQPTPNLTEEQDYAFCYGLYKDGKYPLAAQELARFLDRYPLSPKKADALYMSADCLFQTNQAELSLAKFAGFCREFPSSSLKDDALFRMGEISYQKGDFKKSTQYFTSVLADFPKGDLAGEAAFWIGESHYKAGDTVAAIKYYQLCNNQYPNSKLADYAAYSVGWALEQQGQYGKAIEHYREVVSRFSGSPLLSTASIRMGSCSIHLHQYREAIDLLTKAKTLAPPEDDLGEIDYLIGESYFAMEDHLRALKQYEYFLAVHKDHRLERDVRYSLGWTFLREDNYVKAIEIFGDLAKGTDAIAQAALFRKGIALHLKGNGSQALQVFGEVVSRWPQGELSDDALYQSGRTYFTAKQYDRAGKAFARITNEYPSGDRAGEAYWMAGETYLATGDYGAAKDAFHKTLSARGVPEDVAANALFQEGWTREKLKEFKEATSVFASFVKRYPKHKRVDEAYFWLAESFFQQGDPERALPNYDRVVTTYPKSAHRVDALYGKAWSLFRLQRYAEAARAFESLVASPDKGSFGFDALLRLGDSYYALQQYPKAGSSYSAAIQKYPTEKGADYAWYQIAQTTLKSGSAAKAIARYRDLLQRFPGSPYADDAQYGIGWVHFQQKQYNDAIHEFGLVEKRFRKSELVPKSLYSIGDCYYNAKKYQEAITAYRAVLDRFPSSSYTSDAIDGLQYCYRLLGKDEQAAIIIGDFVRKNPGNGMADRLSMKKAELFYGRGDYAQAIKEYDAFMRAYPHSNLIAEAHYWKGKSLAESGSPGPALAEFAEVRDHFRDSPVASNALLEIGTLRSSEKDFVAAVNAFEELERNYPSTDLAVQAGYEKGMTYRMMGKFENAVAQLQSVADAKPGSFWGDRSLIAIGQIKQTLGEYGGATTLFRQIAVRRTDDLGAEAQFHVGETLFEQQQFKEAVLALLRVKYVFPTSHEWIARAYLKMGQSYEKIQDRGKAREAYRSVLNSHKEDQFGKEADKRLEELQ